MYLEFILHTYAKISCQPIFDLASLLRQIFLELENTTSKPVKAAAVYLSGKTHLLSQVH